MKTLFEPRGLPAGRVRLPFPVWFVRHGQTDWNAARRFQGHADIPLNDTGRAQAARNGEALVAAVGRRSPAFVASPLSRATETLELIRQAMSLPRRRYSVDDRLIEIDLGEWNGRTVEEIDADDPGAFDRREADKWRFTVPGGESYAAAARRAREFLIGLERPTVIVGHGASGRILRGYLTGRTREQTVRLPAPQDRAFELSRGREREIIPD